MRGGRARWWVVVLAVAACSSGEPAPPGAWLGPTSSGEDSDGTGRPSTTASMSSSTSTTGTPGTTTGSDGGSTSSSTSSGQPSCDAVRVVGLGGDPLNVRDQPTLDGEILSTVTEGRILLVVDTVEGDLVQDPTAGDSSTWYEVEIPPDTGFITELFAECTEPPDASAWVWPVPLNGSVSQQFGNPIQYQTCGFHTGIDVGGTIGDPIVAAANGVVVQVGPLWLDGPGQGRGPNAIVIEHEPGQLYTTYGHNDAALVSIGQEVTAGETIAEVGNLGYSFGPHLHFEVLEGVAYSGDWAAPFANACDHYRDPLEFVSP